jgi:hypothetical protein
MEDVMISKLFVAVAGAALLASVGIANAGERVKLTDAQLDGVIAGNFAVVVADGVGVATSNGMFVVAASTTLALAEIATNFSNIGAAPHTLTLTATVGVP